MLLSGNIQVPQLDPVTSPIGMEDRTTRDDKRLETPVATATAAASKIKRDDRRKASLALFRQENQAREFSQAAAKGVAVFRRMAICAWKRPS
jgi:hypothetical protein